MSEQERSEQEGKEQEPKVDVEVADDDATEVTGGATMQARYSGVNPLHSA